MSSNPASDAEVESVREYLLKHIHPLFERTAAEIFEAFRMDYGTTARRRDSCERRLWRHLEWLIDMGAVVTNGKRGAGMTYRKVAKLGVPVLLPNPIACRECGAPWSRSETHGRHAEARQRHNGHRELTWAQDLPSEFTPEDVHPPVVITIELDYHRQNLTRVRSLSLTPQASP